MLNEYIKKKLVTNDFCSSYTLHGFKFCPAIYLSRHRSDWSCVLPFIKINLSNIVKTL